MGTQLVNDAENLAIQMISDTAGYVAHQQTKPVSDDYQESQRASRGAGHITQTTIEQQWESQLINDAKLTANTQLPSVTFDVNSSGLAQRVGEEVSRFQHVDPPRNPNGFWERFEQRHKNVLERQALIAEGRAAANSEVMRESFGQAAANQQNYLDLGYSESVAQTRAAEWTAATELPLPSVAKGIMQASRLANRWGFFWHNEVEGTVYGGRGAVSGRVFNEAEAGGPLRNLVDTQSKIKFTHQGVDVVEAHTSRFGPDAANQFMITRLRAIANGEIPATKIDRNFYSHELREFVRYRRLGWKNGLPIDQSAQLSLWNNTHTATLEEYALSSNLNELYMPEAIKIMEEQEELLFQHSLKLNN
ncbi:hypothetical protein [Rickettsiella endosymbiont of Xylota segnis]|uniref:hypothetical protein n=1 Tax=Rickettsiella endosymbiont of Xylota segnis TaxID=3066238 RepID=UPI0030D48483